MFALAHGTILGDRFRLDELLGQGGMGVVWAATEVETGSRVALKLMKHAEDNAALRRRFLREARAAAAIVHPHIVRVFDVIEVDDEPAIVMELLRGETLGSRLLRAAPLSPALSAELLLPVVSALGAAHALGIVHRDLKPENIFLAQGPGDGVLVKVLDFGIAKVMSGAGQASEGLTTTGSLLGTPAYMSPEQVFGEQDIDSRSDIWSIGMILYECLSGILPTHGENVGQILKVILTRDSWKLGEVVPDLPPDLVDLTERMLSRNREARPSLREVAATLARHANRSVPDFGEPVAPLRNESGSEDRSVSLALAGTLRAPATPPTTARLAGGPAPRSGRAWLAPMLGAAVVAAGVAWVFGRGLADPAPTLSTPSVTSAQPHALSPPVAAASQGAEPTDAAAPGPSIRPTPAPAPRVVTPKRPGVSTDVWGSR